MSLAKFVKDTFLEKEGYCFRPRLVCADGFNMSVQGSQGHYCSPRETQDSYLEMEIGFPSEPDELIVSYAENDTDLTQTVYGYVPVELIQKVIDKHGGVSNETV